MTGGRRRASSMRSALEIRNWLSICNLLPHFAIGVNDSRHFTRRWRRHEAPRQLLAVHNLREIPHLIPSRMRSHQRSLMTMTPTAAPLLSSLSKSYHSFSSPCRRSRRLCFSEKRPLSHVAFKSNAMESPKGHLVTSSRREKRPENSPTGAITRLAQPKRMIQVRLPASKVFLAKGGFTVGHNWYKKCQEPGGRMEERCVSHTRATGRKETSRRPHTIF